MVKYLVFGLFLDSHIIPPVGSASAGHASRLSVVQSLRARYVATVGHWSEPIPKTAPSRLRQRPATRATRMPGRARPRPPGSTPHCIQTPRQGSAGCSTLSAWTPPPRSQRRADRPTSRPRRQTRSRHPCPFRWQCRHPHTPARERR